MPVVNKSFLSLLAGRDVAAAIAATTTLAIGTVRDRTRINYAELIVDATYAADPANYYVLTLQVGGTVVATWSTQTGQQGTLTAGVPASMVLSGTDANLVVAAGGVLSLVATKNGTAANIIPCINIFGRSVSPLTSIDP